MYTIYIYVHTQHTHTHNSCDMMKQTEKKLDQEGKACRGKRNFSSLLLSQGEKMKSMVCPVSHVNFVPGVVDRHDRGCMWSSLCCFLGGKGQIAMCLSDRCATEKYEYTRLNTASVACVLVAVSVGNSGRRE